MDQEGMQSSIVEQASLELRLAEQAFFRSVLNGVKNRDRWRFFWFAVAFLSVTLVLAVLACPWHQWVGWCSMQ